MGFYFVATVATVGSECLARSSRIKDLLATALLFPRLMFVLTYGFLNY